MEIAVVVFAYNRPDHIQKVLEALESSDTSFSKLIIFQDGMKKSTNISEWEMVGRVIKQIKWCNTEIHIASENKGLSESVVAGVTDVLNRYEAVIVLEDDCVPHPKFLSYMIGGLNKYKDKKQVYSIEGGETWPPVNLPKKNVEDAFFCGRISSLGWGTWRDRWSQYERNYMLLKKIRSTPQAKKRLDIWGRDLEDQLVGNITGRCDSWAVFWALKVIEKGGYCLRPYESLITNIGYDGTGVHSGAARIEIKYRDKDNMEDHVLPDLIQYNTECEEIYKAFLPVPAYKKWECYQKILELWVGMKQRGKSIRIIGQDDEDSLAIWGKGSICDLLLQELEDSKKIKYIIESTPSIDQYRGIPVIPFEELPEDVKIIVVIPIYILESIQWRVKNSKRDIFVVGIDELIQ